jgi:hypothetical protein
MIQLDEGPVPCLGKLEVNDHNGDQTGGTVDPTDLAAEVSLVGIKHIRDDDVPDGGEEVVEGEADGLGFGTETRDGDFAGNAGGGADNRAKRPPCQLQGDADSPAGPGSE